jgi:hypothetical protein
MPYAGHFTLYTSTVLFPLTINAIPKIQKDYLQLSICVKIKNSQISSSQPKLPYNRITNLLLERSNIPIIKYKYMKIDQTYPNIFSPLIHFLIGHYP